MLEPEICKEMGTKVTLTIERRVIDRAKKYANSKGRSLSSIIENYLKVITREETKTRISPMVKSLQGSFRAPKGFDYKKELSGALTEKYLSGNE